MSSSVITRAAVMPAAWNTCSAVVAVEAAAIADNRVPIAVGFFLVVGQHHEADGFVRCKVGTTIQPHERSAEHGEVDRQLIAFLPVRIIGRGCLRAADMAVGKGGRIELRRLARFAVVEPQSGYHLRHLCLLAERGR